MPLADKLLSPTFPDLTLVLANLGDGGGCLFELGDGGGFEVAGAGVGVGVIGAGAGEDFCTGAGEAGAFCTVLEGW